MMNETVKCLVCGAIKRDLRNHLKLHDLTSADYRAQYKGAEVVSEATKVKMAEGISKSHETRGPVSEETRKKIRAASKIYHLENKKDPEYIARQIQNAAYARAAKGPSYKHSEDTKQKMRGPRPSATGVPKSPDHKKKLSEAMTGRTFSHTEKTKEKIRKSWEKRRENKDYFSKYIESLSQRRSKFISLNPSKYSNTSIEIEMKGFLSANDLEYSHQYAKKFDGRYFVYDFFVPSLNLLIEVDGEYWHSKPSQIERDKLKEIAAKQLGFRFVRVGDKNWIPEIIFGNDDEITAHNRAVISLREQNL